MGKYSKLIGAIAGNIVAMIFIYLGTKGLAECSVVNGEEICKVFGFSSTQVAVAVMGVINSYFVWQFTANKRVPK